MASLVHGVPIQLVCLQNKFLRDVKYNVEVAGATNTQSYMTDATDQIYGTGQGCVNSPFISL